MFFRQRLSCFFSTQCRLTRPPPCTAWTSAAEESSLNARVTSVSSCASFNDWRISTPTPSWSANRCQPRSAVWPSCQTPRPLWGATSWLTPRPQGTMKCRMVASTLQSLSLLHQPHGCGFKSQNDEFSLGYPRSGFHNNTVVIRYWSSRRWDRSEINW